MNTEQILMYVIALILGMLLANMLKNVCGCKLMEGHNDTSGNNAQSCVCSNIAPLLRRGDHLYFNCSLEVEQWCKSMGGSYALNNRR